MEVNQEEEIDLLAYWQLLVARKWFIAKIVGCAFIVSLIVSLLLPKSYLATTALLPPQQDMLNASLGLQSMGGGASGGGGLGALAGGMLGLKTPADLWVGILKSRTITDAMINRFGLRALFGTKTIEETRLVFREKVKIVKAKDDIISISVEDEDPKRAAQMANAFVAELDQLNKRQVMSAGGRTRAFVEKRLLETKEELAKAEEAVKLFQEENKAIKLDAQSQAVIKAVGTMRGELMAKEMMLQTMLSYATPNHPEVSILKTEVQSLKQGLAELSDGRKPSSSVAPKDIFIPTSQIPALGLQYVRLLREAKIQETLHTLLTQQFEIARIQEAKDSPTVQVLDVATVPEKKDKPKRGLIVLLSTITAGFVSIFLVFFMAFLEKNKMQRVDNSPLIKGA